MGITRSTFVAGILLAAIAISPVLPLQALAAQEVRSVQSSPAGRPAPSNAAKSAPGNGPQKKAPDGKSEGGNGDKKPEGEGKANELKVIRRDQAGEDTANPEELKVGVGEDGRVAFHFRNQPWIALVQWLSDITDQPLDWQELPADRVNLMSPGRYTVAETKDLFNRHLLARGFTILEVDGGITVTKTEGINPAMVHRVNEGELEQLPPYTFVRTLLDAGWLSAEKLAEELKPMISGNGRLTALTTTNRIEAMDAAVNLRQIARLLSEERNTASRDALAPEFKLSFIPAEEAKQKLEQFLGVEKKEAAPMTPQQMQMMQRMAQQNKSAGGAAKQEEEISIVANVRQNSIIIRASREKIAAATEFLRRIDVPSESMRSLTDIESRVQVYRLASLDPEKLIEIVSEMNVLDPKTRIRADKENLAVIVSGSAADRFIIKSLIDRLDGSGRNFEVLQLRRLSAADVAESITFLMGKEEDEDDASSRRSYYYSFYRSNDEDEGNSNDEFRVTANTNGNQVLLWANELEMEEVRSLLIKLGELPPPGGSRTTFRVIDASATPETLQYLQQLRRQWQSMSSVPLQLPDAGEFRDPIAEIKALGESADEAGQSDDTKSGIDADAPAGSGGDEGKKNPSEKAPEVKGNGGDELARVDGAAAYSLTTTPAEGETEADATTNVAKESGDRQGTLEDPEGAEIRSVEDFDRAFGTGAGSAAANGSTDESNADDAVNITIDSQGNLVISSSDTAALDQLEDLMLKMRPPKRPYHVFKIQHATASWVQLNLEDYFGDLEEEDDSDSNSFYSWYYGRGDDDEDDDPKGLGRGEKLSFVWDNDTNTIVVSGATPQQLRTVAELIELWDVPEPVDRQKMRYTKLVPIRYSRASEIAETVKEAYRDLLSSNDKAFSGGAKGGNKGNSGNGNKETTQRNRNGDGSGLTDQESGREGGGSNFSFTGKLSIGVDGVGNTLVVSAEGEPLLNLVEGVIEQLDAAAMPSGDVQVFGLSGGVGGTSLADALRAFGAQARAMEAAAASTPGKKATPPAAATEPAVQPATE